MIKNIVTDIDTLNKQLHKEVMEKTPQEALVEATNYMRAAEAIEDILDEKIFDDSGWSVSSSSRHIRFWNPDKSEELPEGEYYHVYFNEHFEINESTVSEDDLKEIKKLLKIKE